MGNASQWRTNSRETIPCPHNFPSKPKPPTDPPPAPACPPSLCSLCPIFCMAHQAAAVRFRPLHPPTLPCNLGTVGTVCLATGKEWDRGPHSDIFSCPT